ncbi:MAG: redoxin domain-containing protein [Chitinophagaceae bacterium]
MTIKKAAKTLHVFLYIAILANYSYAQKGNCTVEATINGLGDDTIQIMYYPLSNVDSMQNDITIARKNHFIYTLPTNQPAIIAIIPKMSWHKRVGGNAYMPQTKFIELIALPDDKININGVLYPYYLDYTITGSLINEEYAKMRATYKDADIEAVKLKLKMDSLSAFENTNDESTRLFKLRQSYNHEISTAKMKFIQENPDSSLSAYYLVRFNLETFAKYYPQLSSNVRNGLFKALLLHKYDEYTKYIAVKKAEATLTEGENAPNFSLKDVNGNTLAITDLKGKLIVLDFWGTWCGPCIKELSTLKNCHEKYQSKVSFVSIACNDTEAAWKNIVNKYQLDWTQLINSVDNDVSVLYGIKAYPTKIIIDKDLKIVKRFVGATDAFYSALNELVR